MSWPLWAQLVGMLAVCFGVGMLLGVAWSLIVGGLAVAGAGAMGEAAE